VEAAPGRASQLEARLRGSVLSCLLRVASWAATGIRTRVAMDMAKRMQSLVGWISWGGNALNFWLVFFCYINFYNTKNKLILIKFLHFT
jgi:hypothetical protein